MLTENYKQNNQMGAALTFFMRYSEGGGDFLDSTATGDETSVFHHIPESK